MPRPRARGTTRAPSVSREARLPPQNAARSSRPSSARAVAGQPRDAAVEPRVPGDGEEQRALDRRALGALDGDARARRPARAAGAPCRAGRRGRGRASASPSHPRRCGAPRLRPGRCCTSAGNGAPARAPSGPSNPARPRSMRTRRAPSIQASARAGLRGMPASRAQTLPVPAGMAVSAVSLPARPLTTSWMVPSPPAAASSSTPSRAASAASSRAWPGASVLRSSIATPRARSGPAASRSAASEGALRARGLRTISRLPGSTPRC